MEIQRPGRRRVSGGARRTKSAQLEKLIAEATIDCYDKGEQVSGFYAMLEEHLEVPFQARILGMDVVVVRIDLTRGGEIVAICKRGRFQQAVSVLGLPLPAARPRGAEWIEAYRRWIYRR